jgi:hypothetical protein
LDHAGELHPPAYSFLDHAGGFVNHTGDRFYAAWPFLDYTGKFLTSQLFYPLRLYQLSPSYLFFSLSE